MKIKYMEIKIGRDRMEPVGDLFGIFFEDINHAADGGLYGEMLQNGAFEFSPVDHIGYRSLTGWEKVERDGTLDWQISTKNSYTEKNPHHIEIQVKKSGKYVGIQNLGYHQGLYIEAGKEYIFSCYAKSENKDQMIRVALVDTEGKEYDSKKIKLDMSWEKYEQVLVAPKTSEKACLAIFIEGRGCAALDFLSLFPKETYKKRKNGMRRDIAKMLEDLQPRFMRFPGGCLIHDGSLEADSRTSMYRWKNTIGEKEQRPSRRNNWNYNQSLGLGYFEYFQFCEDIGAKPLPVLPAGCNPHSEEAAALENMEEWINDALDLIEYANGPKDSFWGGLRAKAGHPEPFHLEYIGIGNEEDQDSFWERYALIHERIRARYPEMKIINSAGPFCKGEDYEKGWKSAIEEGSDLIDEHYYQAPEWMLSHVHRYDAYSGKVKVFLGEYASMGNTWFHAIAEAAYMIGLERNVSSVGLACYAPLLANADYVDWKPDMIWFNKKQVYGSANYYVQKLFMNNQGEYRLPCVLTGDGTKIQGKERKDKFAGDIYISGKRGDINVKNICISSGKTKQIDTITSCQEEKVKVFSDAGNDFEIKGTFVMPKEGWGFEIYFGWKDETHYFHMTIGGWQNHDILLQEKTPNGSCHYTQKLFHVEPGREYDIKMQTRGNLVSLWIDGTLLINENLREDPEEPLYCSAAEAKNGDIIVKVVNVSGKAMETQILLEAPEEAVVTRTVLEGYEPAEENSFDEPEKIRPYEDTMLVHQGTIPVKIAGYGLHVYKIQKNN